MEVVQKMAAVVVVVLVQLKTDDGLLIQEELDSSECALVLLRRSMKVRHRLKIFPPESGEKHQRAFPALGDRLVLNGYSAAEHENCALCASGIGFRDPLDVASCLREFDVDC
jgi:hypothetical protein